MAKNRRLDRVVEIFEDGELRDPVSRGVRVHYLIFEMAEDDARCQMDASRRLGAAWCARVLHHAAVGLRQLHSNHIAHQDVKPANVLCFRGNLAKLADLGSAVDPSAQAPHVHFEIAGDEMYAPPELLYNWISPEWSVRRYACDQYLLGSLGYAMFTGVGITPQIIQNLPAEVRPDAWRGTYKDAMPYVRHAFYTAIDSLRIEPIMLPQPPRWRDEMTELLVSLTDPDPQLRGDPLLRRSGRDPYDLERYVSRLDSLATRASIGKST